MHKYISKNQGEDLQDTSSRTYTKTQKNMFILNMNTKFIWIYYLKMNMNTKNYHNFHHHTTGRV